MKNYEKEMLKVLNALNEAQALQDIVVAGSWSMYFYE